MKLTKIGNNLKELPVHFLGKQSITKCGCHLYTGGVLVENVTRVKERVTCKNCLRK